MDEGDQQNQERVGELELLYSADMNHAYVSGMYDNFIQP